MSLLSQWTPFSGDLEEWVTVQPETIQDLHFWLDRENTRSGVPLRSEEPSATLMTDASLAGWGAHLVQGDARLQRAGVWPTGYEGRSINTLELETVLLAIEAFSSELRDKTILILTDNSTAVSYLAKQGGTHSSLLCSLTWQI